MESAIQEVLKTVAEWCRAILELLGLVIILVLALVALGAGLVRLYRGAPRNAAFFEARQRLGRGILLGLEFLVAADIIKTVAIELTFRGVGVLGLIVLIRTFLSFTLEVEMTGRWPWQRSAGERAREGG